MSWAMLLAMDWHKSAAMSLKVDSLILRQRTEIMYSYHYCQSLLEPEDFQLNHSLWKRPDSKDHW